MKRILLRGVVMAWTATLVLSPSAVPAFAQSHVIEGEYMAVGTNPDGSSYTGVVTINRDGDMYRFHWRVGTEYHGHGTLKGDILTVYWGAPDPVIYTVKDGGRTLEGVWAGGRATETLRR